MYVYKPGSGFSGPSVMVEPGFDMKEVSDLTQSLSVKAEIVDQEVATGSDVFEMSQVSNVISSIESQIVEPTNVKR